MVSVSSAAKPFHPDNGFIAFTLQLPFLVLTIIERVSYLVLHYCMMRRQPHLIGCLQHF
jgi:hypothetical protein